MPLFDIEEWLRFRERSNFFKGMYKTLLVRMLGRVESINIGTVNKFVQVSEINFIFHKAPEMED